jgi:hypothetical protein
LHEVAFGQAAEKLGDWRLPHVGLVTRLLLGGDLGALELGVWPPVFIVVEAPQSFGKKLVAIAP